jgi:protein TonB
MTAAARPARRRRQSRSGRSLLASLLLHGGAFWLLWHVAVQPASAGWRAADEPSAATVLHLLPPEPAIECVEAPPPDRQDVPVPALPEIDATAAETPPPGLSEAIDGPIDHRIEQSIDALGPGPPQSAEHPVDLLQHRRDWLLHIAQIRIAQPVRAPLPEPQPHPPAVAAAGAPPAAAASGGASVEAAPFASANAPPRYPFVAWRRGWTGTVVLLLEINAEGTVANARVERSSGFAMLDDAALDQLATWRFTPARRGDHAVPSTFRQAVTFRLVDGRPIADT